MDLVNKKIGKLQVIEKCGIKSNGRERSLKIYKCLCECGKEEMLSREQLTRNQIPACYKCARKLKFINLKGKKFGKWSVLELFENYEYKIAKWKCVCECGTIKNIRSSQLINGRSKSCGCEYNYRDKTRINLVGKIFGRLKVIEKSDKQSMWLCECECGNKIITRSTSLKHNLTKSCGCLRVEKMSGTNSKFWSYGLSAKMRKRNCSTWSKNVKKKDGNICKKCDSTDKLHAHHIVNWSFDKTLGYDIKNGITLCENCHKLFHKNYGKKENNIKQLNEFLNEK